ncbi:hypothetical protein SAMN05216203_1756 [Marinobacter daqiaonensis]|uniref:Uncharacterized protein n=1 Tax=Marinobacter daqiaonensis TaxID=650891 RepID=A0A1I6I2Z2_9GAMM|nr:hypothetical protein [Marinobacter daqiaonensis]SFR60998.1 hypothetical protein SAMN05216203_1756 [Marinobacter daqiaonensis]
MTGRPSDNQHPWRRPLLTAEFTALAVLVGSMLLFSSWGSAETPIHPGWLLIPAAASLVVFLSFLGLMYLRWVAAAGPGRQTRQQWLFYLLALTLLGVWAFAIVQTWNSLPV